MSVQVTHFHENEIAVVNRDDGRVALELSKDGAPTGVILMTAETAALQVGPLLTAKGEFLLREVKDAIEGPAGE
ncbi:hypothetical protein SEA_SCOOBYDOOBYDOO_174 [Mycobacterium phage ScoobyDoobyDoo]|nr:hypothetical protein SEA_SCOOBYDOOBYDOO_174 [Mycobacterium phage ScoobyDoobyDoo]